MQITTLPQEKHIPLYGFLIRFAVLGSKIDTFTRDSYSFKIWYFRKLLTMSSVKTDVNPSGHRDESVGT